jgi:hypothetical protein
MTSSIGRTHHLRKRVIDYVLYLIVACAFFGMTFVIESKWGHDAFIRWGGLVGFTSILFGHFVSESRLYLRQLQFWILTLILLTLHLAAFTMLLKYTDEWRLMWFTGMALEYPVLVVFRSRLPYPS